MDLLHTQIRKNPIETQDIDQILKYCKDIYSDAIQTLKKNFEEGTKPNPYPTYPFIGCYISEENLKNNHWNASFGIVYDKGFYGTTLTHVDLFENYIREQLRILIKNYNISFVVGESYEPIPLPYAIRTINDGLDRDGINFKPIDFIMPDLKRINDDIVNGLIPESEPIRPMSLFTGERIDFSIHRLEHYSACSISHFQSFIIFVNYQLYIDLFIQFGLEQIKVGKYDEFIGPDDQIIDKNYLKKECKVHAQMPAFHLKRKDNNGITFINIGVGPSNSKNITDHLAVLRPHCWLMLGHCAGLRHNQLLGDYVLAHAYVRADHVLDDDLPNEVPIPPLAEVQQALERSVGIIYGDEYKTVKRNLRTGTLLTTSDRNWELKSTTIYERFKKTRAIAVDMESATIAANGFRFRVPYGTLLCVSDKPIQGELKLKSSAKEFYKQRIKKHLLIGLKTIELLQEDGFEKLHSRKLRGFDDPPFR